MNVLPHRKPRQSTFQKTGWQFALLLLSSSLFVSILLVMQLTSWADNDSRQGLPLHTRLKVDVSVTLGLIRVLQGLLTALTTLAISRTLQLLQWVLVCRPRGLAYPSLLSLSQSTSYTGSLRIMFGSMSDVPPRAFSVMR